MAGITTTSLLSMGASAVGTAVSTYGSIRKAQQQSSAYEAMAETARNNQELALSQASAEKRAGYEDMIIQRRKTAKMIGKQRAIQGASGTAADVGSNLDIQADTAAQGEIDAVNLYNQGIDKAYNYELEAWNYGNQANAYSAAASSTKTGGYLQAAATALGGIAGIGKTWGGLVRPADDAATQMVSLGSAEMAEPTIGSLASINSRRLAGKIVW